MDPICHKAGGNGLLALGTTPPSHCGPSIIPLESICHPILYAKHICSSAAWMVLGQKAAGAARQCLQRPCAENRQLIAHKDDAQLISTLWFLVLKSQRAKIPQHLQELQSIPIPMLGLGSVRSPGSCPLLPAAAGHEIFRGP